MFVLVNDTRPGLWTYDPCGERSTHKNRRRRMTTTDDPIAKSTPAAATTKKKRLGTTLRRSEKKKANWQEEVPVVTAPVVPAESAPRKEESRWCWSIAALTPRGLYSNSHQQQQQQQLYPDISPLRTRTSSDVFMDDATLRVEAEAPPTKKQRPSQFVDTTREPFPPIPQIDAFHQVHSQTSSSISFSQYSSQYSQSQSQGATDVS
jgi:hypothetical protein